MISVHLEVSVCNIKFLEKSVGKVNPLRTLCVSAVSRFSLFCLQPCSYVIFPQPCALLHIVCIPGSDAKLALQTVFAESLVSMKNCCHP